MISLLNFERAGYRVLPLPESVTGKRAGSGECIPCAAYRPAPELNGNLQIDTEIHLPSPGMDVDIAYFYNASDSYNGPFGYGRTISPNLRIQASGSPLLVIYDVEDGLISVTGPAGVTSYSQDPNRINTKIQPPIGSPTSYTWDPANRMTKATLPAGQVHTNQYRHDNMRVKNVTPSGTEQFVWDGEGLPDLMFVVGSGGAAGHLAVRGKNLSRVGGTFGGGGSLGKHFNPVRQDVTIEAN